MLLNELFTRPDPESKLIDTALAALHRRVTSKGKRENIEGYAFDIVRSFNIGMSSRQLAALYRERYNVTEGYRLQLERSLDMDVLHITDTSSGKRTEVRGKPGYEASGYDPNDPLHKLLDKIGKAANISDLMNGEVTGINIKHPDGNRASAETNRAFNESLDQPYPYIWGVQSEDEWAARAKTESGAILDIRFEYWDGEWDIEFLLDGGYKATAAGDQFRIFATVVAAIKEWWKSTSAKGIPVSIIRFSADKLNNQTGKTGSREKLYRRFAQQFANSIGFTVQRRDKISATDFELVNTNYNEHKVNETRSLTPQISPLRALVLEYLTFTSTGIMTIVSDGAKSPQSAEELKKVFQTLNQSNKNLQSIVNNEPKLEANKTAILKNIHDMMTYAIAHLKANMIPQEFDAKKKQINSVLTKYNDIVKNESISEAWSEKYKRSIDCSNPQGFSQRAHCASRKKGK